MNYSYLRCSLIQYNNTPGFAINEYATIYVFVNKVIDSIFWELLYRDTLNWKDIIFLFIIRICIFFGFTKQAIYFLKVSLCSTNVKNKSFKSICRITCNVMMTEQVFIILNYTITITYIIIRESSNTTKNSVMINLFKN